MSFNGWRCNKERERESEQSFKEAVRSCQDDQAMARSLHVKSDESKGTNKKHRYRSGKQ